MESVVDVFYPERLRVARFPEMRVAKMSHRILHGRPCCGRRLLYRCLFVRCRCSAIQHYDPADDVVLPPHHPTELTDDDWQLSPGYFYKIRSPTSLFLFRFSFGNVSSE
jgi:hypothetical protein